MERNSFSLRDRGQRPPTANRSLIPVERPWNPPSRRQFSSGGQRSNLTNADVLAEIVDRIDDPPAYLRDDSNTHRPFSNPRFGALRIASQEGPDIEIHRQSVDHPQGNSGNEPQEGSLTDQSGSDEQERSDGQVSSQDPSFSNVQDLIERFQDSFDTMKEVIIKQRQDIRNLRSELKAKKAKDKELELQISKKEDALLAERQNCDIFRKENEKLRGESQRDQQTFEKSQSNVKMELDKLSKDLQSKEKELQQVQREFARLKQKNDKDTKRRESAEKEAQVFKHDLFELQKRANEEKRELLASQEEFKANATKQEELIEALTEQVTTLEDVLSFLGRVCNTVQQSFQEACLYGRRGLPEVTDLPDSIHLTVDQECDDYKVFGKLLDTLNSSPSAEFVLELGSAYVEALQTFFRTVLLRDAAHSHWICSSTEIFKKIKTSHEKLRQRFQVVAHCLEGLSSVVSSEWPILRQRTSTVAEAFEYKGKEVEGELLRMMDVLVGLKDRNSKNREAFDTCQKHLKTAAEHLVQHKKAMDADSEDLQNRISKSATENANLYRELENAKGTVTNLRTAASDNAKKQKEMEACLKKEMEGLRTSLTERNAQLKDLSSSEASLRKSKEELMSSSRQALAERKENQKNMTALTHEVERLSAEKEDALRRMVEAEHAAHQMSEKVAEALSAKQDALAALILEKSTVDNLRSKLEKASEAGSAALVGPQTVKVTSRIAVGHCDRQGVDDIAETNVNQRKITPSSPTVKRASSLLCRDAEDDVYEIDDVPKRTKRRGSVYKSRKNLRQKRTRATTPKTGGDMPSRDSKRVAVAKKAVVNNGQSSSISGTARDEEWDIDAIIGNKGD